MSSDFAEFVLGGKHKEAEKWLNILQRGLVSALRSQRSLSNDNGRAWEGDFTVSGRNGQSAMRLSYRRVQRGRAMGRSLALKRTVEGIGRIALKMTAGRAR